MLFRAPGINKLSKRTTAIGIDSTLEQKSRDGFGLAVADMTTNLDAQLSRFKTRVKEENVAKVEYRAGYSGGAINGYFLLLAFGLLLSRLKFRR